jgi:hypothetical protein
LMTRADLGLTAASKNNKYSLSQKIHVERIYLM